MSKRTAKSSSRPRCRLYLVSPPALEPDAFLPALEAALAAGDVAAFLLRLESAGDEAVLAAAKALRPVVDAGDAAFLLLDRAGLVAPAGADGMHVTGGPGAVAAAREMLAESMIVGAGCGLSRHDAMLAAEAGADYLAFGSASRAHDAPADFEREAATADWWAEVAEVPCVLMTAALAPLTALSDLQAEFFAPPPGIWVQPGGAAAAIAAIDGALAAREEAA